MCQPTNLAAAFEDDTDGPDHRHGGEDSLSGDISDQQMAADYSDDTYEKFLMDSVDDDDDGGGGGNYSFHNHSGHHDDEYHHHENNGYAEEYDQYSRDQEHSDSYSISGADHTAYGQGQYPDDQYSHYAEDVDHYAEGEEDKSFQCYDDSYNDQGDERGYQIHGRKSQQVREQGSFYEQRMSASQGSDKIKQQIYSPLRQLERTRCIGDLNENDQTEVQQVQVRMLSWLEHTFTYLESIPVQT